METKKFEALMKSSDLGSFTKSANVLGYTQSGLTHMMNALEQEVGFALLERGHYGTRLTTGGKQLEPAIRKFLQAGRTLDDEIHTICRAESQWIRVGAYSSMALHWLPSILQQYREEYPDVRVDVQMGSMEEIYGWVRCGEVDLAFVSLQEDLIADFYHLKEDPLVAILPEDDATNYHHTFPVKEFNGREFLMPALGFTRDIMPVFKKNKVRPKIRKTTVDDTVVVSMVAHGLGVSIMTEMIMTDLPHGVKVLPIDPPAHRDLGIIVRNKKELKTGVPALIDCAVRTVKKL